MTQRTMTQDSNTRDIVSLGSKIGRRRFVELTGIGLAGGLAGCSGDQSNEQQGTAQGGGDSSGGDGSNDTDQTTAQDRSGGHLRVRLPRSISMISPVHTPDKYANLLTVRMLYSQLSWLDYDNQLQNDMATSWEHNDAIDEWIVELRDDATFSHDGSPVRAEDLVATINTIWENDFPSKGTLGGIDSVEKVDDTTAQFNLTEPNADFPVFLTRGWASFVPKSVLENNLGSLTTEAFGSGPFVLESYSSDKEVVMKRNPDYYMADADGNSLPYVDRLTLKTVEDYSTAIAQLQNKEVDIDRLTDFSQLNRIKNIGNIQTSKATGGRLVAFVMDNSVEPWNDNRVRKAMKLAIDREAFVQNALQGAGTIANDSILSPIYRFYKELPQRTQDIERAKSLLAEAGYPDGFHLTEDFDITLYTPQQPRHQLNSAQLFKEQFKQIGVEMELQQLTYDQYVSEVWGKHPSYCTSYGTYQAANQILMNLIHSEGGWWSENHWENEEKDRLLEQASSTTDQEKRAELYGRVQELMHEEGPYVIPYFANQYGVHGNWVEGWVRHPLEGHSHFDRAWLTE